VKSGGLVSLFFLLGAGALALSVAGGVSALPPLDAGVAIPDAAPAAIVADAGAGDAAPAPPPLPPPPPPPAPVAPVVTVVEAPTPPPPSSRDERLLPRKDHFVGVGLDLGVSGPAPDLGILGAYEPFRFLRVAAGFDHNIIGFGVKGAVTAINPYVVPVSLTAEFGHFFDADANSVVRKFVKKQKSDVASLKKVGYDYTNLLLGFETGSRLVRFYIRGGTTFARATASDFQQSLQMANVTVSRASDPKISYQGPCFKLGLFFFFP
jgi:hypothetical protein